MNPRRVTKRKSTWRVAKWMVTTRHKVEGKGREGKGKGREGKKIDVTIHYKNMHAIVAFPPPKNPPFFSRGELH